MHLNPHEESDEMTAKMAAQNLLCRKYNAKLDAFDGEPELRAKAHAWTLNAGPKAP
jgi:hypothetical protein